jgi:hypothetical protein
VSFARFVVESSALLFSPPSWSSCLRVRRALRAGPLCLPSPVPSVPLVASLTLCFPEFLITLFSSRPTPANAWPTAHPSAFAFLALLRVQDPSGSSRLPPVWTPAPHTPTRADAALCVAAAVHSGALLRSPAGVDTGPTQPLAADTPNNGWPFTPLSTLFVSFACPAKPWRSGVPSWLLLPHRAARARYNSQYRRAAVSTR